MLYFNCNLIMIIVPSQLLRHSEGSNSYVDKFGSDGGHKFSVKIEKRGNEQSRLVIHYGPHLAHVSPVAPICPKAHEADEKKVFIQAADFAHWKVQGVFKKYVIQFETNQEASEFVTCYKSSAPEVHEEIDVSESDLAAMGKHFEKCVMLEEKEGECHACWNQGLVGDVCDNCGEVMKWKTQDDGSEDTSLSSSPSPFSETGIFQEKITDSAIDCEGDSTGGSQESEDEYVFANTQDDWPVSPLMPFHK